jgi:hypothetical protein
VRPSVGRFNGVDGLPAAVPGRVLRCADVFWGGAVGEDKSLRASVNTDKTNMAP